MNVSSFFNAHKLIGSDAIVPCLKIKGYGKDRKI